MNAFGSDPSLYWAGDAGDNVMRLPLVLGSGTSGLWAPGASWNNQKL